MLRYNTQLPAIRLPEYGRNIQQMVEHCLTIEDRDMRNSCAEVIVESMANLFPELKNESHKLWNHLAIMSEFKLDVDYPCEIINAEDLQSSPEPIPYPTTHPKFRHYGKTIPSMIEQAAAMEDGDEKTLFVTYIANQMKKLLLANNPEAAEDDKVLRDIFEISNGAIKPEADSIRILDYVIPQTATGKRKRKK